MYPARIFVKYELIRPGWSDMDIAAFLILYRLGYSLHPSSSWCIWDLWCSNFASRRFGQLQVRYSAPNLLFLALRNLSPLNGLPLVSWTLSCKKSPIRSSWSRSVALSSRVSIRIGSGRLELQLPYVTQQLIFQLSSWYFTVFVTEYSLNGTHLIWTHNRALSRLVRISNCCITSGLTTS